jgi:hypothetical protein
MLEDRSVPSTLTVTNTNDSGPGSLRAEIAAAQSGDTIVFDPSLAGQTITLTSGELAVNTNLTIDWTGPGQLPITANFASRVFDVTSTSASVTLDNLDIVGGSASNGGGIYNTGYLTLNSCQLAYNVASGPVPTGIDKGDNGGAIDNKGTMVINGCFFVGDLAQNGGALENYGVMTITNTGFFGNEALGNAGGIDNHGTLAISDCNFNIDLAFGLGQEVSNVGTLTVTGSTFFGGGPTAIANFGSTLLDSCTIAGFQNASATGFGGGVFNKGNMTISNSTITGCVAPDGSGIYNAGNLTLSATAVIFNGAANGFLLDGGGIYNTGTLAVTNGSTVTGNTASAGADLYNLGKLQISSDSTVGVIGP